MTPPAKAGGESPPLQAGRPRSLPLRYLFIDFRTADEAAFALSAMNGHPFDAKHQFKINFFTDIERFQKLDETYVEPAQETYRPRVRLSPSVSSATAFESVPTGTSQSMAC